MYIIPFDYIAPLRTCSYFDKTGDKIPVEKIPA
jgi:hypothetical protein